MRMRAIRTRSLLATLLLAAACGGTAPRAADQAAVLPPAMTVERFLRAANQNDLDTMSDLFGTRDGPVRQLWPRSEVDSRMFMLASVLRHSDYTITGEQIVPGRREEATQLMVRIVLADNTVNLPFTLVRNARTQHWLIEDIPIDRITRRSGTR
jgi:hypothetical protein